MTPPGTDRDQGEVAQGASSPRPDEHPHHSHGRMSPTKDSAAVDDERRIVTDARRIVPATSAPLPYDEAPPLPEEAPPQDDGWDCMWDGNSNSWYFLNRFTGVSQWENPRVPQAAFTSHGSYDRFANYSSSSLILSYPNPCPPQICRPSYWLRKWPCNQFWCARYRTST